MNTIQDSLQKIYDYSSERMRYAEGKNGALLAVTALVFFRMMDSNLVVSPILKPIHFISIFCFALAILICVSSFVARLNIPKMMKKGKQELPEKYVSFNNLLSSIRLAHYKPEEYTKQLAHKLGRDEKEVTQLDIDYAEHIIVNSMIIITKYRCFHYATLCMMVGMCSAITVKIWSFI
ncbi:hypothetical protein A9Q84_16930 [Halobacteriovorax marinus]|uniref:Pycsar effector protein domain-containing protein n=1 Tax=Halobacteriovorax marinus TaxID=97084 RepID=A0A1Y5F4M9_9BACT|nr:hypothetical protein A9Q84_16930 [Halobacteriovorax marinus]